MQIIPDKKKVLSSCCFCSHTGLDQRATIKNAPGFLGCTQKPFSEDTFLTFHISICPECGLIQTDAKATPAIYSELHSEAIGATWGHHHQTFSHFIQNKSSHHLTILEIGVSSQPIARNIKGPVKKIFYIDPILKPPFSLEPNEEYLSGFFPKVMPPTSVDLVIASHVLEHIPNSFEFMTSISQLLTPQGQLFISIPQFKTWFESNYFNAISAEHIHYPFQEQMEYLAHLTQFSIEIQPYKQHSLFAALSPLKTNSIGKKNVQISYQLFNSWITTFNQKILASWNPSNTVSFVAGASHLAQYFLLCNPSIAGKITGIIDNSPRKWGQRLYGTQLKVHPFDILKSYSSPTVFLPPSPYREEMKQQILKINASSKIVV
jgi:hypothetical protein